ncbi:MAG: nuclear transport factor 2 family protein [Ginsengibacter sp.]
MDGLSNQQILEAVYRNYAEGNMPVVLSAFDKDIEWIRPGAPSIPFAGTFTGIKEVTRMFGLMSAMLTIKQFSPERMFSHDDTVLVLGHDIAEVITTGKTYSTDWVQAFTFKDGKITHVKVYLDTKSIADACMA